MTRHIVLWTLVVAFVGAATVALAADTLESVEKKIAEQVGKYKSLQYTSKSTSDIQLEGSKTETLTESVMDLARRPEGKYLSRVESKMTTTQKLPGEPEQKTQATTLIIYDGQYVYMLTKSQGQTTAIKSKPDPSTTVNPFDEKKMFEIMRKDYDLKLLPDQTVDGKEAWVIEATPKDPQTAAVFARTVSYYDKKTGMSAKSLTYDKAGKVVMSSIVTDFKPDPDLPADRFVFKAPPGVEVVDMTNFAAMSQQAAPDTQPAPEPPDEPAKTQTTPAAQETPKDTAPDKPKDDAKDSKAKKVGDALKRFGR